MTYDVFISYARAGAGPHAPALAAALRLSLPPDSVFLDTNEIAPGAPFPEELAAAVAGARVVVVFADDVYFTRPWCVREFEAALSADGRPRSVLVTLPMKGDVDALLLHLPPALARRAWPQAERTEAIAAMVARALGPGLDRELALPAESVLRPAGVVPVRPWRAGQSVLSHAAPESLGDGLVGREEALWEVFRGLETRRAGGPARSVLLCGGAGSGKSQLAAEYMRRAGPRHYTVACWLDADVRPEEWSAQLLDALPLLEPTPQPGAVPSRIASACAALDLAGRRVLWIVDDVPEAQAGQAPAPLLHWCPALGHASVVLTSRRPQVYGCDEVVAVDVLAPGDAVRVLTRPDVDASWLPQDAWLAIARWVGGLPLALRILHAGLADGSLAAKELRAAADAHEPAAALDDEIAQLAEVLPPGALRGVSEAFAASFDALRGRPQAFAALLALAQLRPWVLPESLVDLVARAPERAVLARRGWLQAVTGDRGERAWRLHRVAASFVRGRSTAMDGERALLELLCEAVESARIERRAAHELGKHLMQICDPLVSRINAAPAYPEAVVRAGQRFGAAAALFRLEDPEWGGLRYVGTGWAGAFAAGPAIVERARGILEHGDEAAVASLPRSLQALGGNPEAAEILAAILKDARDKPRWQAIVHASGYASSGVLVPLWEALAAEPNDNVRRNGLGFLPPLMQAKDAPLRHLLSVAASRARDALPAVRTLVATTVGSALAVLGEDGAAGGFTAPGLRKFLIGRLGEEEDDGVREAIVGALGVRHEPGSWQALVDRVTSAAEPGERHRALRDLVRYLEGVERPEVPGTVRYRIDDDDGSDTLEIGMGGTKAPRSELWQPVVDLAVLPDGTGDDTALAALAPGHGGFQALSRAFETFQQPDDRLPAALTLAERCVARFPDDANVRWWRGMAREGTGDADGALDDFEFVASKAPQFGYPFKRIARLRLARGELDAARAALAKAQVLIPQDPQVQDLAAQLGS